MAESPSFDRDEIARQAAQHLRGLQAAGIDWLGSAPPPPSQNAPPSRDTPPAALFADEPVPAAPTLALDQRRRGLELLAEQITTCSRCEELCKSRTQTVFADGPVGAELCFIGEAPGGDEDAQGVPFVGAAGQMLNKILAACGLRRDEVYIMNVIKCRPPNNRTPLPTESGNCREYFLKQLELLQPTYIVALGGCAAQNLLQTTQSLGMLRGRFHDYHGMMVMCTYHPSYLLPHRHPEKKRDVWEDMKMLMAKMGRTIPPTSR